MTAPRLSRRRFIGLAAGTVGAATSVGGLLLLRDDPGDAERPGRRTEPTGEVEAVGRRYLEEVPSEADRAVLVDALPRGTEQVMAGAADREAAKRLSDRIREDFSRGRVVELDGWILSESECRAAALVVV